MMACANLKQTRPAAQVCAAISEWTGFGSLSFLDLKKVRTWVFDSFEANLGAVWDKLRDRLSFKWYPWVESSVTGVIRGVFQFFYGLKPNLLFRFASAAENKRLEMLVASLPLAKWDNVRYYDPWPQSWGINMKQHESRDVSKAL